MEQIRQIFNALNRKEVRNLKSYLSAFHFRGENNPLLVIELLEKDNTISSEKVELRLFGEENRRAFLRVKYKLESQMLEFLGSSPNLENNPRFNDELPLLAKSRAIRNYSSAMILEKYGLGNISKKIVEQAISESTDYSFSLGKLLNLTLLQRLSSTKDEVKWDLDLEVESAFKEFELAWRARLYYEKLRRSQGSKFSRKEDILINSKKAVSAILEHLQDDYSVQAHYYYLKMLSITHLEEKDLASARETIQELIDLIGSTKGFKEPARLCNSIQQLAIVELESGRFEEAYKLGLEAEALFPKHRKKRRVVNAFVLLNACVFSDSLGKMQPILTEAFSFLDLTNPTIHSDRLYYYQCNLYFLQGEYQKALENLFSIKTITVNKAEANNMIRTREIQLSLDMNSLDRVSSLIDNQRKHLRRHDASSEYNLISKCFRTLERQSFNFQHAEIRDLLAQISQEAKWTFEDFEVIPFVTWLRSRVDNISLREALAEDVKRVVSKRNSD